MRVAVVDTETSGTGTDAEVLELAVVDHATHEARRWRFRPLGPVDPRSTAVHGLTAADLAGEPTFREAWGHEDAGLPGGLRSTVLNVKVWIGYNAAFDVRMIEAELRRMGIPWDTTTLTVVDPYRLWCARDKRKLVDACRRFLGEELADAHSAVADSVATSRVLRAMMAEFGLGDAGWDRVADECDPARRLRVGTKFRWDGTKVVYGFGKHNGKPVHHDLGYAHWMLRQDFASVDHEVAGYLVDLTEDEFYAWVRLRYPPPPVEP